MEELLQAYTIADIAKNAAILIAVLSIFIQISPIKWNPISVLLKWMGNKFNNRIDDKMEDLRNEIKRINDKVEDLESKISESENKLDMQNAVSAKRNILKFGGDLIRGVGHTEEEFIDVMHDLDDYESYCTAHPDFPNNRTVIIAKRIKAEYDKCIEAKSFLV